MNTDDVLDEFRASGALREGHFVLSSGLHSPVFLQKNLVFQYPERTERLCKALADKWHDFLTNTGNGVSNRAIALENINAQSAVTGVRATDNGSGIDLVAVDGRNITTAFTGANAATATDYGLAADNTYGGTLDMSYVAPSGTAGSFDFTTGFDAALTSKTIGAAGTAVSAIDISSTSGADLALKSVDAALQSINSSRADLGAIQNRFSSVVTNLQTGSENLSAARSRIMDADYAKETANLSRTQILQQAGTAMLAQANQSSQSVLSLLR